MRKNLVRELFIDDESIDQMLGRIPATASEPFIFCGIHVTTLLASKYQSNKLDLQKADAIFADGYSIHLLSRVSGYKKSERIATTDLINRIYSSMRVKGNGSLRIAFIGGDPGVADLAAQNHLRLLSQDQTYSLHGFQDDWSESISELRDFNPDVVLVGMGMPLELKWILGHKDQLPAALFVTCGGLLRLLAGIENRSPNVFQQMKLEWLYRWIKHPKRVGCRYFSGGILLVSDIASIVLRRGRK